MKKRNTVDRWTANLFKTPQLERKADETDRKIDHRVGRQLRDSQSKDTSPDSDWRRLVKIAVDS